MVTTVTSAFGVFSSNLILTENQQQEISVSHKAIRDYLSRKVTLDEHFLTGSYDRNTLIRQSRDVDFMIVLNYKYWVGYDKFGGFGNQGANGPSNLLNWIRTLLKQKYPTTQDISRDGQAVTVRFDHIDIDVVPAFRRQGGGYLIPNTKRGTDWLPTNPKEHQSKTSAMNALQSQCFVPLVKMIKYWNFGNKFGYAGFFLEMFSYDIFFHNLTISDYATGMRDFFHHAIRWLDNGWTVPDTWSGTNLMPVYLPKVEDRDTMRRRLDSDLMRVKAAIIANAGGDNKTAIGLWQEVFIGGAFPSYG